MAEGSTAKKLIDIFPEMTAEDIDTFKTAEVLDVSILSKSEKVQINILLKEFIPPEKIKTFENSCAQFVGLESAQICPRFDVRLPLQKKLLGYWDWLLKRVYENTALTKGILEGSSFKLDGRDLFVKLNTKGSAILKSHSIDKLLSAFILDLFSETLTVSFIDKTDETYEKEIYMRKRAEAEASYVNQAMTGHGEGSDGMGVNGGKSAKGKKTGDRIVPGGVVFGERFTAKITPMAEVDAESSKVCIVGEIFDTDFRDIRGGRTLCSFDMTDRTGSLTVKRIVEKNKSMILSREIVTGACVMVRGELQYDRYIKENVINFTDILKIEQKKRMDEAEEKRVELHLHTQMSNMDGVTPVKELVKRAASWGHKAIAITDHGVVQAFPEAFDAAKGRDIKIIYGTECYILDNMPGGDFKKATPYHAIILAKNATGLKNLYKLISESHMNYFYKKPRIPKELFSEHREGLLLGTACEAGELYTAIRNKADDGQISKIADYYDYFEIQPLGNNEFLVAGGDVRSRDDLIDINKKIIELGEKTGKLVVATCDVHFMDPEDEVYRRILMGGQGYTDADNQAPLYLRTTNEMLEEFAYLDDEKAKELVIKNPNLIADQIEDMLPIPDGTFPPKIEGSEVEIRELAYSCAKRIYGDELPEIVEKRLVKELDSIIKNGFSVMYAIAQKLVAKSLKDGYLVGSRGSVGSSFVANMAGITEVNSLEPHYICGQCKYSEFITDGSLDCGFDLPDKKCPKCGADLGKDGYDIPFETFLGFDGDKEPDIDLNFSGEYQSTAHKYTEELFGKGNVFRAGTISTLKDKTAFGFVKGYCEKKNIVNSNAEINRLVKGCSGIKKTTGQHPGGLMILPADQEIYNFTPIQRPADDQESDVIITHFDYHSISGRLLKLDILGHDDPTTIKMLEDLTGVDARKIPLGEKKTMSLFNGTDALGIKPSEINSKIGTFGLPEFGTKMARQMLEETMPTTVSELIKISGLSHGTDVWINNAQDLIKSKTATLAEAICCRDDILIYLTHAGLPPVVSFKIMEDVRKGKGLKDDYEETMIKHKVPVWYIDSCKKIKYMFPKAHAAAYVMMALRIAWFKVYHPKAFYATYFSVRADDFDAAVMTQGIDKVKRLIKEIEKKDKEATVKDKSILTILEVINEMYARGIKFLPVDLYKSDAIKFLITDEGILPPLKSLQGLGVNAAKNIVRARDEETFISIDEFRVKAKVTKKVVEILKDHGCLEGMHESNQLSFF